MGVEGPSDDKDPCRGARLAQAQPAGHADAGQGCRCCWRGDELGHSQGGNNNAYAQDNETTWIDWAKGDQGLADFTARLIALRKAHPVLRQKRFLHARPRPADGLPDVIWRRADGRNPTPRIGMIRAFAVWGWNCAWPPKGPMAGQPILRCSTPAGMCAAPARYCARLGIDP
jgi:isoamylase